MLAAASCCCPVVNCTDRLRMQSLYALGSRMQAEFAFPCQCMSWVDYSVLKKESCVCVRVCVCVCVCVSHSGHGICRLKQPLCMIRFCKEHSAPSATKYQEVLKQMTSHAPFAKSGERRCKIPPNSDSWSPRHVKTALITCSMQ